jgi:hypothetical protein
LWPSCVNDFFGFGRGDAALCPSVKSAFSLHLGATPATLRVAMWAGPGVRFSWLSHPSAVAGSFSQMGQPLSKSGRFFAPKLSLPTFSPGGTVMARNMLYLKSVL